jgi:hypothetical protein
MDWILDLLTNLYTRLRSTGNYSATAETFPACFVFNSRSLTTASNNGDSSVSRAQITAFRAELNSQLTIINTGTLNPMLCG